MNRFKTFGLSLLAACTLLASAAPAAVYLTPNKPSRDVGLAWDASPDATNGIVTGYYIYYGTAPREYTNRVAVGNVTTCTISNLAPGVRYFFTATARDALGNESDWCNEVFWLVPKQIMPVPSIQPTNSTIRVAVEKAASPSGPWSEFAAVATDTAFPGFYRAKVSISPPEPVLAPFGVIDMAKRSANHVRPPIPGNG